LILKIFISAIPRRLALSSALCGIGWGPTYIHGLIYTVHWVPDNTDIFIEFFCCSFSGGVSGIGEYSLAGSSLIPFFPCAETRDKGNSILRIFSKHASLTPPLHPFTWDGVVEFGWLGPSLSSVLANAWAKTWDMLQPLQTAL
jgi:hypothetical protein